MFVWDNVNLPPAFKYDLGRQAHAQQWRQAFTMRIQVELGPSRFNNALDKTKPQGERKDLLVYDFLPTENELLQLDEMLQAGFQVRISPFPGCSIYHVCLGV